MFRGKIPLFVLTLSTLVLTGCTFNNSFDRNYTLNPADDFQRVGGYGGGREYNDPGPIVGNKDDQQSVIEPVKGFIQKRIGKELTHFQTGQSILCNENLFLNFSCIIENKLYYGVAQAYVNKNGWVIDEMSTGCHPVFKQFPVMCFSNSCIVYNQYEKNFATDFHYLLLSGFINDDRVRTIKLSFEDGNYLININKGQKTYMYLYTGTAQYKSFTAYDTYGRVIHKQ